MTNKPVLGLAFVGLGQAVNRIFHHNPDIDKLPYKIVAAVDPREHALETFRKEFGGKTYKSLEELCQDPAVDVLYIATPPELHCEQVLMAAQFGKHVVVEKPMALTMEECEIMNQAAEKHGIKLLAGHTHSFDAPIRKMREIIHSGQLGDLVSINTWNYNEFNPRPWPTKELQATHGPILNQGPHQVDIVRQLGGGMVKSIRATTIWDPLRNCEGGYSCFLQFENGVPATLIYDARGFFDTAELFGWVDEGGGNRDPDIALKMRKNFRKLQSLGEEEMETVLESQKEQGRYGAGNISKEVWELWGYQSPEEEVNQQFFGLTIVSCQKGAIRQTPGGLKLYGEEQKSEVTLHNEMRGRMAELMELYEGVVDNRPIFHDGRWAKATLEVCLGIMESAAQGKEIYLSHQVPVIDKE